MTHSEMMESWSVRQAAFHEAGHGIVALALGSPWVSVSLHRLPDKDPAVGPNVSGLCQFTVNGTINRAAVGYAGAVGEFFGTTGRPHSMDELRVSLRKHEARVSRTDRISINAIPKGPRKAALHLAFAILESKQPYLEIMVEEMIRAFKRKGGNTVDDYSSFWLQASPEELRKAVV